MKAQPFGLFVVLVSLGILGRMFIVDGEVQASMEREGPGVTVRHNALSRTWQPTGSSDGSALAYTASYTFYLPLVHVPPRRYALQFDGVDDFAAIVDSGQFDLLSKLTVEAWIKPLSLSSSGQYLGNWDIVYGSTTEPSDFDWFSVRWGLHRLSSPLDNTMWGFDVCPDYCLGLGSGRGRLQPGRWDHLAGTYDGSQLAIYQNGKLIGTVGQSQPAGLQDVNFIVLGAGYMPFHGVIDEVRIWNVARSQAEIQADLHRTLTGSEPGLIGYWRLDDSSGQQFVDGTSYHSDGRLGSSAASDSQDPIWVESDAPID